MTELIHTRLWDEAPDPRSPVLGRAVRLAGYDYYGELLGRARWVDVLWLLFTGEAPEAGQAALLEDLAVALANPGPREPSVHAAMCGGIGGSPPAASLMAALAVASGGNGGAEEVARAMGAWQAAGLDAGELPARFAACVDEAGNWPGFAPHSRYTAEPVLLCLAQLAGSPLARRLALLQASAPELCRAAGSGLGLAGVAAAAFADLGLTPRQGEALYLLLRLPGALAHGLEQMEQGYRRFPFFGLTEIPEEEECRR